jgi:hypothetical protein
MCISHLIFSILKIKQFQQVKWGILEGNGFFWLKTLFWKQQLLKEY